jgi:hypothetical protein
MLTLVEAAHYFDEQKFTDSYGSAYFYGQILPFADSTRSGNASKRRILEVAFGTVIPVKKVVTEEASGIKYLISSGAYDYYDGDVIRIKYPVMPVSDIFSIRTIGQVLAGTGGTTDAYVSPSYIRRVVYETEQSDYDGGYEMYHSSYYTVTAGQIFYGSGKYYRARENSRIDDIGLGVTEAVELQAPVQTMTFQGAGTVYNPATDSYTPPAAVTGVSCFVEKALVDFYHEALGFVKIEEGDKSISFLKATITTVKPEDTIGGYRIMSVTDNSTFWTCHARK